jgi:hypothetical protein
MNPCSNLYCILTQGACGNLLQVGDMMELAKSIEVEPGKGPGPGMHKPKVVRRPRKKEGDGKLPQVRPSAVP